MAKMDEEALKSAWSRWTRSRDLDARNQLSEHYVYMVTAIARRIAEGLPARSSVTSDDLAQEGFFGLLNALDDFDAARSVTFSTYATFRIVGAIRDSLRETDRVGRTQRRACNYMTDIMERARQHFGRVPDRNDMCEFLGVTDDEFAAIEEAGYIPGLVSMDAPTSPYKENEGAANNTILESSGIGSPERDPADVAETNDLVAWLISPLSPIERQIFVAYYIDEKTMKQIGDEIRRPGRCRRKGQRLCLSESRISQILSDLWRRMQDRVQLYKQKLAERN